MDPTGDLRHRARLPGGAVLAIACALVAVGGLGLAARGGYDLLVAGHLIEDATVALVWSALGGLLSARAPGTTAQRLFLTVAAAAAITVASGGYASWAHEAAAPGMVAASWLSGWTWVPSTFLPVTLVLVRFPEDARRSALRAVAAGAATAGIIGLMAGSATDPQIVTVGGAVPNPLALTFTDYFFGVGLALLVVAVGAGLVTLLAELRNASGERRRQLAPVVVAAVLSIAALAVALALPDAGPVIQGVTAPLVPLAICVGILRYRLYDVELVVRRSVVFVTLSGLLVASYAAVVAAAAALLGHEAGFVDSLIGAAVVALVFQPARQAMQNAVGRLLYGDRDAPAHALKTVSVQLAGAADPDEALKAGLAAVRKALRIPWAAVETDNGSVHSGARPTWADDSSAVVPLLHLGTHHGDLVACGRGPRDPLSASDRRLLAALAPSLAAVVASGRLLEEARRSRELAVHVRAEERRRLRRDLHDGMGPLLSAVVTHADTAVLRLARAPEHAAELLEKVRTASEQALETLRRVVEDLRPAGLDELGLAGTLVELAESFSVPGLVDVRVDAAPLPPLDAATEVAAYRIASESITNAIRHGRAARVEVDLRVKAAEAGSVLAITIRDDGVGFDPASVVPGVGLASLARRAEEVGGRSAISSSPAGTTVSTELPLPSPGTSMEHQAAAIGPASPAAGPGTHPLSPAEVAATS